MNYRSYIHSVFWMLFTASVENAVAQNLIKNPSFETFLNCPKKLGNLEEDVADWSTPTEGSTDYFNACSKAMGTPVNFNGEQPANFGAGYVGLYFYAPQDYREYIQTKMGQPLVKGENYTLSFYVSLAERADYAVKEFGIQFTEAPLKVKTKRPLSRRYLSKMSGNIANHFTMGSQDFYPDKENWVLVATDFVANGTEKYLIIGNFKDNVNTQKLLTKRNVLDGSYYYLDMVSLIRKNDSKISTTEGKTTFELDSINVFQNLLFRFDAFELLPEAKAELDEINLFLNAKKHLKIELLGHTDAIGNNGYNKILSENRAKAVARYLMEQGIDSTRISYQGFGSEQPLLENATSDGRKENRRVEFRITD